MRSHTSLNLYRVPLLATEKERCEAFVSRRTNCESAMLGIKLFVFLFFTSVII
jgi:hypothetical protein